MMKRGLFFKLERVCWFLIVLFMALTVNLMQGEVRTWSDLKGRSLKAEFLRQDATTVWLKRVNGKQIKLPKKSLSEADRKYLLDLKNLPGQGERFHTENIEPDSWKAVEGGFKFENLLYTNTLQGDHFVVAASEKVRHKMLASYLEAAERLWRDIATDLPLLNEVVKEQRMLIILADGEDQAKFFSNWQRKHASKTSASPSFELATHSIVSFSLDHDLAEKNGLLPSGRLFRLDAENARNTRLTWAERIHFITSELLLNVIRECYRNGEYSLSFFLTSYAYHREYLICEKIETQVTFGGNDEVEGFSNGKNWAGSTRKLLDRGLRPSIDSFLKKKAADSAARDLGVGHGLMQFIHSDPARLAKFNAMFKNALNDERCPDPATFAKALGYETPKDLNAAWYQFMLSDEFK